MPADPNAWAGGRLEVYGAPGMGFYGTIPPNLLDWTQDVHDLNGGRPELHDLRWRMSEFRSETASWDEAKECLVEEIRKAFPELNLPTIADANALVVVLEWSRDDKVRKALENGSDEWPALLSAEVLRRAEENWADPDHARILSFLSEKSPERGDMVQAALPGCRDVVLRWDLHGDPTQSVALDPSTLHLEYREYATDRKSGTTYVAYRSDVVPARFVVRRSEDQAGVDWYEWARKAQLDGSPQVIRCSRQDLIETVRTAYRPSSAMMRGLGAWLERLPPMGSVCTRLSLSGPKNRAGIAVGWWVPPVFGKRVDDRANAAGIMGGWYRPRTREVAVERLRELLSFATTEKLRAIMCYVAGAPVFAKLSPDRPLPYLELVGESGAGKTHTTRAAIAVLWGVGDGYREYVGGDVLHSGFRRSDYLSATDLPVLVDESSLTRSEREHMRAAANGSLTSRGGTDLLHRGYAATAPVIFTSNSSPDDSDSSSAERHGDTRRRIRITFDDSDRGTISGDAEEFTRWLRSLPEGPIADHEDGGGAALHRLNEITRRGEDVGRLRSIVDAAASEQDAVLALGAELLGIPPIHLAPDNTDQAGEAFLEWLRVEAARYLELRFANSARGGPRADPAMQRIRPVDERGDVPEVPDQIRFVYVTASALEEYKAHRRRIGSASPYHRLSDLSSLAPLTGQSPKEVVGVPDAKHPAARGHLVRVNGVPVRAAKIALPVAQEDAGAKQPTLEEVGPDLT